MNRRVFSIAIFLMLLFLFVTAAHAQTDGGLVASTYQRFERGLMVWESDTGTIYIMLGNGFFARVRSQDYGALQSNSIAASPGLIAPVMGFGQVWGNNAELRRAIGGAVDGEGSFFPTISTFYGFTLLDTPDGRRIMGFNNAWVVLPFEAQLNVPYPTTTPAAPPMLQIWTVESDTITTEAAFQLYENGFMIWRADTGDVWVFFGQSGGSLHIYAQSTFADLPDNPVQTPPSPFVNPINGFGRVWYNDATIQSVLGWARTSETAYTAYITEYDGTDYRVITGPDRTSITVFENGTWTW